MRGKRVWQPESLSGPLGIRSGHCVRVGPASGKQSWVHFGLSRVGGRIIYDLSEGGPAVSVVQEASGCIFRFCLSLSPISSFLLSRGLFTSQGHEMLVVTRFSLSRLTWACRAHVSGFSLPPPPSASEPPRKKAQGGPGLLGMYLKCMQSPFFYGASLLSGGRFASQSAVSLRGSVGSWGTSHRAENTWREGPALQTWPHLPLGTSTVSWAEHGGETWATSDSTLCIRFS